MKVKSIILVLVFALMLGCSMNISSDNKKTEEKKDDGVPRCASNDIECFFNNIMNGHDSYVEFATDAPVFGFIQRSKGYYTSDGCEGNKCTFEIHYNENKIIISDEAQEELLKEGYTEEDIKAQVKIMENSINEAVEGKKMYCSMSKDEAQTYLDEYLKSIKEMEEGHTHITTESIGAKKCSLVPK